jgi:nitroreductase
MSLLQKSDITKSIIKSQHCQRNWDLTKSIPDEDIDLMVTAVTQCPSKQNVAFYKTHFITNREIIEAIHAQTSGFGMNNTYPIEYTTNSQTLANLLVVFEEYDFSKAKDPVFRNDQTAQQHLPKNKETLKRDQEMAVGIAAGYLNLTSNLMGYSTGCCACFNPDAIVEILGMSGKPLLLMGIGYKDPDRNRRIHHTDPNFVFPTKSKQPILVNYVK